MLIMEWRVVHDDDAIRSKLRNQAPLKPISDPNAVGRPTVGLLGEYALSAIPRDDVAPLVPAPWMTHFHFPAARRTSHRSVQMLVNAALVNVNYRRFLWKRRQFLVKRSPLLLVAFRIITVFFYM
jgi:hypothetical protein